MILNFMTLLEGMQNRLNTFRKRFWCRFFSGVMDRYQIVDKTMEDRTRYSVNEKKAFGAKKTEKAKPFHSKLRTH